MSEGKIWNFNPLVWCHEDNFRGHKAVRRVCFQRPAMLAEVQDKGNYCSKGHLTRAVGDKQTSFLPLATTWKMLHYWGKGSRTNAKTDTDNMTRVFPSAEGFVSNSLCCTKAGLLKKGSSKSSVLSVVLLKSPFLMDWLMALQIVSADQSQPAVIS